MEEIDFSADQFEDVIAKDSRYSPKAYAFVTYVVHHICSEAGRHVSGEEILDEFKEIALDQYGPLTYTVLTDWGLSCTEDVGEVIFNLADSGRIHKDENDTAESFAGGYDFKEEFLGPYQV